MAKDRRDLASGVRLQIDDGISGVSLERTNGAAAHRKPDLPGQNLCGVVTLVVEKKLSVENTYMRVNQFPGVPGVIRSGLEEDLTLLKRTKRGGGLGYHY